MQQQRLTRVGVLGLIVITVATGSVVAQQAQGQAPASGVTPEVQIQQRRFQFQLMEGVLKNAVRQGASEVATRAQGVMPTGMLFMGQPKARGFPLDHYGIVFDVEIPQIRESAVMLNQLAMANQGRPTAGTQNVANGTTRAMGVVPDDPMARSPIADPFLADPNQFYRDVIKARLVDAMLDYSRSLDIGTDEWLSIVARGEEDPIPTSMFDDSQTLILRIKGADLVEFYSGKITREEARKRVVESQF